MGVIGQRTKSLLVRLWALLDFVFAYKPAFLVFPYMDLTENHTKKQKTFTFVSPEDHRVYCF